MRSARVSASSTLWAIPPSGCGMPSRSSRAEKRTRSSAWSMASRSRAEQRDAAGGERRGEVERRLAAERDDRRQQRRPRPSGDSASMTLRTLSGSSGSKYSRDDASKSVETVSGFELIITARQPARRSVSAAWTAQ